MNICSDGLRQEHVSGTKDRVSSGLRAPWPAVSSRTDYHGSLCTDSHVLCSHASVSERETPREQGLRLPYNLIQSPVHSVD